MNFIQKEEPFHLFIMICFHGSHTKGLKQLTYTEENSRFGGENGLIHGAAIYLTVSEQEAQAYATGGSYYKVQISRNVFDATNREELIEFIRLFEKNNQIECSLESHEQILGLIQDTLIGKSSGVVFAQNIFKVLSNESNLYFSVIQDSFKEDSDACLNALETLFNYSFIKLNNSDTQTWILCLDKSGAGIEILEEIEI